MIFLFMGCGPIPSDSQPLTESTPTDPEVLSLSWSSDTVTTDETLAVHISSAATSSHRIEWTVNGAAVDVSSISLDGREHFDRNDEITVTVTPIGARGEGTPVSLGPLTVDNAPPVPPSVTIYPTDPVATLDTLLCLAEEPVDPDGDPVTIRHAWMRGDQVIGTDVVLYGNETSVDELTCQVFVSDATAESPPGEARVTPRQPTIADLDPYVDPFVWISPADLNAETVTVYYAGDLTEKSNAISLRYGVDGKYDHEDIELEQLTNHLIYTRDVEMSWNGKEWEVEIELPSDVTAIHMSFLNADDELDDRGGLEYHRSRNFPYIPPYLTWNDEVTPSDGVILSYETDIPCMGVVAYGTDPDSLDTLLAGSVFDTLHHVPLTDLQPETTYYYQVYDSAGQSSDIYSFTTTPEDFTAFTLLVMADLQDNGTAEERWPEVGNTIADHHPDIDVILMPGDMTADDYPGFWWRLFEGGRALFPYVQMMPVLGNHETPTGKSNEDYTSFARYFELPRNGGDEAYYAQTYGNARFLNFNSEIPTDFEEKGTQTEWAREETAMLWDGKDPVYDWVFAAWHTPVYNVGERFAHNQYEFRPMTEVFDGHVDWVFTGHEQLYQRFLPVHYSGELAESGSYGQLSDDGVGYMVVPAAGNHLWNYVVSEEASGGEVRDLLAFPTLTEGQIEVDVEHGYVIIEIDGRDMNMEVWGLGNADTPLDPHVRDSISYTKP